MDNDEEGVPKYSGYPFCTGGNILSLYLAALLCSRQSISGKALLTYAHLRRIIDNGHRPKLHGKLREEYQMPRYDGTGPVGSGPMTGHGSGYCIGLQERPMWGALCRRPPGWRPRWGRGAQGRQFAAYVPQGEGSSEERTYLEEQASMLQEQLERVNQRIEELGDK